MLRTIFLGTVAMVGGVFWLGDQYGVDRAETINLLVSSAGFVVVLAWQDSPEPPVFGCFGVCSVGAGKRYRSGMPARAPRGKW